MFIKEKTYVSSGDSRLLRSSIIREGKGDISIKGRVEAMTFSLAPIVSKG